MSSFAEHFEAYTNELRNPNEEIRSEAAVVERNRALGKVMVEARKKHLQVVVASMMRQDAASIVDLVPKDIKPTTLVITKSEFVQPSNGEPVKERLRYNKGGVDVETKILQRRQAFMVSPRLQRTIEDYPMKLVFAPIFVATDNGELLIAPKDILTTYEDFSGLTPSEELRAKQAMYRKSLRGRELEGKPRRYPTAVISNSPRLATDDDLVPTDKLSVLHLLGDFIEEDYHHSDFLSIHERDPFERDSEWQRVDEYEARMPEVLVDWRSDLLAIVKV